MSVFCYFVLSPTVGFDDSNITMVYAENIVAGHGYVYNVGSERVEGSTSPLWTAIAALGFLLPIPPEVFLTLVGLVVSLLIIWVTVEIGLLLFRSVGLPVMPVPLLIAVGFLSLPSFLGWTLWSLMDFGLWLLLLTVAFWFTLRLLAGETAARVRYGLAIVAALLVLTRPEGAAAACAFSFLLAAFGMVPGQPRQTDTVLMLLGVTCLSIVLLFGIRYLYFGDIFPNTYYAKVSTNAFARVHQGMVYAKNFLISPYSLGIIILAMAAPLAVRFSGLQMQPFLRLWVATMLFSAGGASLYIYLGGDHFGSFRFFLFLFPALFPLAGLTLFLIWRRLSLPVMVPYVAALVLIAATWWMFWVNKGDYEREFRIAEEGREMGRLLNEYPGRPSIGIVAAGGIALTYDGHLYDLLGLNWVKMARSDRQKVARYINHGGFSRNIFYAYLPDIVLPRFAPCDKEAYDTNPFFPRILDYVFTEAEFQELYTFECWRDLAFYRRTEFPTVISSTE